MNGTKSFEVNSSVSEDHCLNTGSGQGDPKSSFVFNLAAVPLNHYLTNSPEVPRYKIEDESVDPVMTTISCCFKEIRLT